MKIIMMTMVGAILTIGRNCQPWTYSSFVLLRALRVCVSLFWFVLIFFSTRPFGKLFSFSGTVFNLGEYRRQATEAYKTHEFFRPDNAEAMALRSRVALDALKDACDWIESGGEVAVIYFSFHFKFRWFGSGDTIDSRSRSGSHRIPTSFRPVSDQFQTSFRPVSERFLANIGAPSEQFFEWLASRFSDTSNGTARAVAEQYQNILKAASEPFLGCFSRI